MEKTIIKKVNRFGKIGNIIITILLVVTLIAAAAVTAATVYLSTLPKDGVVVNIVSNASIQVSDAHFSTIWDAMVDGISYSTEIDPTEMLSNEGEITPPENQNMHVSLSFFHNDFSSATIHSEGTQKVIDAVTDTSTYKLQDAIRMMISAILFLLSVAVCLWMLRALFKVIAKCTSPFCDAVVKKMQLFSFSLILVAIFASIGETLATSFLSAGKSFDICIQWGVIAAFIVTSCLVTIFKYGVQLQRESDETL